MKPRILTWLQVTADQFHLGNYFWAVKPFMDLCTKFPEAEKFLFVANMHSLTTVQDGSLRQNAINTLKLYLACGVDPKQVFIYNQSDVPGHAQLQRVLACITHMGFMERMHAFKDKMANKKANEISIGLFTYPILMAADIILYDATLVPTGKDQKQHVEFARDIAQKFNTMFGETFTLPDSYIAPEVAVIPGIDGRKMSKSYNNFIGLLDDDKQILKRVKQIATDALAVEDPKDPDTCNVYNILKLFLDDAETTHRRKRYTDGWLSYKEVKEFLYEKIMAFVTPIQEKYKTITDQQIVDMLAANANKANTITAAKIGTVYQKTWLMI